MHQYRAVLISECHGWSLTTYTETTSYKEMLENWCLDRILDCTYISYHIEQLSTFSNQPCEWVKI